MSKIRRKKPNIKERHSSSEESPRAKKRKIKEESDSSSEESPRTKMRHIKVERDSSKFKEAKKLRPNPFAAAFNPQKWYANESSATTSKSSEGKKLQSPEKPGMSRLIENFFKQTIKVLLDREDFEDISLQPLNEQLKPGELDGKIIVMHPKSKDKIYCVAEQKCEMYRMLANETQHFGSRFPLAWKDSCLVTPRSEEPYPRIVMTFSDGEKALFRLDELVYFCCKSERDIAYWEEGATLTHTCKNKKCVNPDHLEIERPRSKTPESMDDLERQEEALNTQILELRREKKQHGVQEEPDSESSCDSESSHDSMPSWYSESSCYSEPSPGRRSPDDNFSY